MKTIFLYILLGLLSAMSTKAQSSYETTMTEAFNFWKNDNPTAAANLFEQIAKTEKENWLPYYYAAQVKIVQSFPLTDRAKKKQLLDQAQELLDKSRAQEANEAEMLILQAMLHTSRLTIDPDTYGMQLSPVITGLYTKAATLEPENPRLALSQAEWKMGSARYFGEDPSKFCPDLKAARVLFEKEKQQPTVAPTWGKERLEMLIEQTCKNQ